MSIEVTSNLPDPVWSEEDFRHGDARDALRIETAGEAMLDGLLPGINTVTSRARYYSFFAWALNEFIRAHEATEDDPLGHTQAHFYEWLRPRENVLILAYLSHGHRSGAVGTDQGRERWQDGRLEEYALDWRSLTSARGGAYEANYSGALEEMNIAGWEAGLSHHALRKPVGVRLAAAYGRSVGSTLYVEEFWDADRIPRRVVDDFADAGCLCRIASFPEEREALIDAFFRHDTADVDAGARRSSLCLLLDVVEQSRGAPLDLRSVREVMYFWSYGDARPYIPKGGLVEPAKRWRFFQLRQYYVFGIECIWTLFLNKIHGLRCTPEEYLGWLLSSLDLEAIDERYGLRLPTHDVDKLTLREFHEAVEGCVGEQGFAPGPAPLGTRLNEHELYMALDGRAREPDANPWAGSGLLMLALLRRRCKDWHQDPGWGADGTGEESLSVEAYLGHVRRAMNGDWTVARWLSWFHERYLWLRHRRVALDKMMGRGRDPALFAWEEGAFCGLYEDRPKMNNPRIENAFRIMEDLELVRRVDGDHQVAYALTPGGEQQLTRFLEQETRA